MNEQKTVKITVTDDNIYKILNLFNRYEKNKLINTALLDFFSTDKFYFVASILKNAELEKIKAIIRDMLGNDTLKTDTSNTEEEDNNRANDNTVNSLEKKEETEKVQKNNPGNSENNLGNSENQEMILDSILDNI